MTTTAPELELPDQVLEFVLGDQRYCVGIEDVDEIVRAAALTALPESPPEVAGVMDLRGQTTTILELGRIFEVSADGTGQQVVIIDGDKQLGWLVDRVREVTTLRDASVDPVEDSPLVSGLLNDDDGFTIWIEPELVNGSVST